MPLYRRSSGSPRHLTSKVTNFSDPNKAIKLLEDRVRQIRDSKPELRDLMSPSFKPMDKPVDLISSGGLCRSTFERRIAELSKTSSGL